MWRAGGRGKQAAAGAPSTDRPHPRTHGNGNCRQARTNVPTPLGHSTLPPARAVSSSPTTRTTPLAPAADPARFDARGGLLSPGPQNTPRLITDAMSRPVLVNRAPARPCWGQGRQTRPNLPASICIKRTTACRPCFHLPIKDQEAAAPPTTVHRGAEP